MEITAIMERRQQYIMILFNNQVYMPLNNKCDVWCGFFISCLLYHCKQTERRCGRMHNLFLNINSFTFLIIKLSFSF